MTKESLMCFESLTATDQTESLNIEKGVETAISTPVKDDFLNDDDEKSCCPNYQTSLEVGKIFDFDLECKLT